MNIPNDFNPMGINNESGLVTKGLDFYCPYDDGFDDVINGLTATSDWLITGYFISTDTDSTIGSYLRALLQNSSNTRCLNYNDTANMFQYGTNDFSVSFWMKAPRWQQFQGNTVVCKKAIGSNNGFCAYRSGSSTKMNMTGLATSSNIQGNIWIHWCFVRKDGVGYWYKDGVLDNSGTFTNNVTNTQILRLGFGGGNYSFAGGYGTYNLKALRIYNRALETDQITLLSTQFDWVKYYLSASSQTFTFYPYPNNQTVTIQYTPFGVPNLNFEIISGTLPQGITFNTSTGVFTGKSTDTTQDHTVNLTVRISGDKLVSYIDVSITLQLKKETVLEIPSPQNCTFTTESTQYAYVNVNTGGLPVTRSTYILANGVEIVGNGSSGVMTIRSQGDQTSASSTTTVVQYYTEYHPTKVYVTYNINVVLNQITASNQTAQFYTEDGVKTYQVKYTSPKTITPVYSLTGTLPSGITFDTSTGTFTYDGTNTTAGTTTVQVTIASSTGASAVATVTITLQIKEGSNPLLGMIFNAPLQDDFSATGGTLSVQNSWLISTFDDKKCAYGYSASYGMYYKLDNPITGNVPFTISIQYYATTFSDSQAVFYIGKKQTGKIFGYEFDSSGNLGTAWGDGYTYDNSPTITFNEWTIFTAVYDLQTIKLYTNGVLMSTLTSPNPLTLDIQPTQYNIDLTIGGRLNDRRPFKRWLRNAYVFNYAMNATEVAKLYNYTKDL